MKKIYIVLLAFPCFLFAQNSQTDSLDAFITKEVAGYNIPGLAIGIIKNNRIIFKKGYGINSTIDKMPITTQTVFPIMSCTKAFTAAAIGILVDQGKVHWNDKVIQYLPDFKLSDAWITKHLTIADILSHRSGLEGFEGDLLWYGTDYSRQEIVRRIQYSTLRNNFRSDFGYQNVMYIVAGLIIEKVSRQTWDDFIQQHFFRPLSMKSSSTHVSRMIQSNNYAHPHLKNIPIPIINMDNVAPAGGINSNIDDMLQWMQVWINKGIYNGREVFSNNTYKAITSAKVMLSNSSDDAYGFGWYIGYEDGRKILSHGGGMPGYKSLITILPDDSIGIVMLTNKITYLNEELADVVIKYLQTNEMNWKEIDANMYGKNFHFSWEDDVADTTHKHSVIPNLSIYKGEYEDKKYGKAVINEENGKAILSLLPSKTQFTGTLYYVNKDTLRVLFNDRFVPAGEVIFNTNKNGKAVGFKLDISSSDFLFKYLDFKKE